MILNGLGVDVWLIEGAVYLIAIGLVMLAFVVWQKNHVPAPEAENEMSLEVESET